MTFKNLEVTRFVNQPQYKTLISPVMEKYKTILPRNPWSMEVYNNKLYFGHGDMVNNTGACSVYFYDLLNKEFGVDEGGLDLSTERINTIKEIDGDLYILAMDHTGANDTEVLFRKKTDTPWETLVIPFATEHSFDIINFNNKTWVCGDKLGSTSDVWVTDDEGITWTAIGLYEIDGITQSQVDRLYNFIELKGDLYVINNIIRDNSSIWKYIFEVQKFIKQDIDLGASTLTGSYAAMNILNGPSGGISRFFGTFFIRNITFNNKALSISVVPSILWNGQVDDTNPVTSKFVVWDNYENISTSISYTLNHDIMRFESQIRSLSPDESGDQNLFYVWDVKIYNNKLFILGDYVYSAYNSSLNISFDCKNKHYIEIYSTEDLTNWTLHFSKKSDTFGRSFALFDNYAYIGIGSTYLWQSVHTGEIWKVKI